MWGSKGKLQRLLKQANILVDHANILANSSNTSFATQFPWVQSIPLKKWTFLLTVAGVFAAASRLATMKLEPEIEDEIMRVVDSKMEAWDSRAGNAFDDCREFFERTYDSLEELDEYKADRRFLASDSIGTWLVWNLLDRQAASRDELNLSRALGVMVIHSFSKWWIEES